MKSVSFKKKSLLTAFLTLTCVGQHAYSYTFDGSMLESLGIENVDLSMFSGDSDTFSGKYVVTVYINNNPLVYSQTVHFYTKDLESYLCVTPELIDILPLKKLAVRELTKDKPHITDAGECYSLESLDSTVVNFDPKDQRVNIELPQLYLTNFDPFWVAPKNRDYGISGLVFDYSLLGTYSKTKRYQGYQTENSVRSYGVLGANIGRFRVRANYQYDSEADFNKLEWDQVYAFTDVASWNAKLFVGELNSRTNVFDSVRFKGVSLFSDESMMPAYLQGYAPQITGSVSSNSIVTIKQYGATLRSEQVPPGPFAISNLPSYINGTVDVEIEESDGKKYTYQVDIAQVPFLTRKGDVRYNVNLGSLDAQYAPSVDTKFLSIDASYGWTNNVSLFGGLITTSNNLYRALNIGVGLNLESFGAISFDVTNSENKVNSDRTLSGYSYRVNYAKRFASSTSLNLAGYRFSSREFTTLSNYIDMKSNSHNRLSLEKNRFTLSLTQSFPSISASLTASVTKGSYWNKGNISNYSVTLNKTIKRGFFANSSVQLSLSRNNDSSGYKNNRVGIFVNIPLSDFESHVSYSASYNDRERATSQQATYYTALGKGNASVGFEAYHAKDLSGGVDYSLNASYDLNTRYGKLTTMANHSSDYKRVTAGFDGSLAITSHGIATFPRVYEDGSRLIIDTEESGVQIKSTSSRSNIFGLAGISNVPNYYRTSYIIDNDNLPENLEIQNSVVPIAVADGTIAYRSVGAISGEKAISRVVLEDGSHPPFGAVVYRKNGGEQEVAMIAERGLTYLSGLNKTSSFIVKWSGNQCNLKITSLAPNDLASITCYME